jgi:nucleotide sugar dehydrogenase
MKTVLVCGFGNIGKHLYKELSELPKSDYMTFIYDKYKSEYNDPLDLTRKYDYVFICVPTEMKDDGSCNTEEVLNAVNALKGSDTIIIKSAIPVGFVDGIKDNVNIIVSPEFWGTTQHCENPDFLILGGYRNYTDKVAELYTHIKNGYYKFYFTDHKTAELVKYMENCWIATKVTFCNEFARIANAYGISYNELRELWIADGRVSPSHTFVYPETPYYDSHCLNKDIPALISFCKENHIATPLMKSVNEINMLSHLLNDCEEEVEY